MLTLRLVPPLGIGGITVAGIEHVPGWGFVAECMAIGSAIGLYVAYRGKQRDPDLDTWKIQTRWASFGAMAGILIQLIVGVSSWL